MIAAWFLPDSGVGSWTMLEGIWRPHIWVLAGSMVLTLILTPICRAIAMRYHAYDLPDERLKTHGQPIPYLGGVAIFLGWAIPVLVVAIKETAMPTGMPAATAEVVRRVGGQVPDHWIIWPESLFWILGAALVVMLLGLIDDLKDISPKLKILGQVGAALLLAAGGMIFKAFPVMEIGGWTFFPPGTWYVLLLGTAFQIVLVVGAANATNLLDGLDGLCSGVTAIICCGFLLLATSLLAWDIFIQGSTTGAQYVNTELIVLLSFALLGSVLGFIPYNFNPASIFMGDAGSMFLGFMAAAFMILFAEKWQSFKWFLGAMVIFGLPIFDTGLALVRRVVNHQPIFAGDRSHFYDQLVDRGCSVRTSVLVNYGLAVFFGLAGVGIMFLRLRYALPIYIVIFIAIGVAALKLGLVRVDEGKSSQGDDSSGGGDIADASDAPAGEAEL